MDQGLGCAGRAICWTIAAGLCFLIGLSPAAAASRQSRANRDAQENAARKACLIGDYGGGVEILADLFIKHKDSVYIFNQGRCLEQNSRYKDAIARFEEFRRISEGTKGDLEARIEAQKHIDDCKAKLADEENAQALAARPIPQPIPPSDPQLSPKQGPTEEIVETPKTGAAPLKSGRGLVIAGLVTGGVGVAAVIAGVAFNLKANSMANEMEGTVDAYTSSKDSSQKLYQTLTWVGYGVGAACLVTGTILTLVGRSRPSARTDVALVPAVGPDQAGVVLLGGF